MLQLTEESSPSDSKPTTKKAHVCIKTNCKRKATYACQDNDDDTPVFCAVHGKDLYNTYEPDIGMLH
jgi:hypothetical protein